MLTGAFTAIPTGSETFQSVSFCPFCPVKAATYPFYAFNYILYYIRFFRFVYNKFVGQHFSLACLRLSPSTTSPAPNKAEDSKFIKSAVIVDLNNSYELKFTSPVRQ